MVSHPVLKVPATVTQLPAVRPPVVGTISKAAETLEATMVARRNEGDMRSNSVHLPKTAGVDVAGEIPKP